MSAAEGYGALGRSRKCRSRARVFVPSAESIAAHFRALDPLQYAAFERSGQDSRVGLPNGDHVVRAGSMFRNW